MAKIKILKVDYHNEGFVEFDYTRFQIEYEVRKWYFFGKSKVQRELINIPNLKADAWLNQMKKKVGVWQN